MDDEIKYQVSMKADVELTYEDGFADGYSRAWQECWEYFRATFSREEFKKEEEEVKDD